MRLRFETLVTSCPGGLFADGLIDLKLHLALSTHFLLNFNKSLTYQPRVDMSDDPTAKNDEGEPTVPKVEKTEEGEDDGDDEGPAPVSDSIQ